VSPESPPVTDAISIERLPPDVNWTAVLHAAATVVAGIGIFAFDQPGTIGLLVVAAVLFVAGIVVARRDEGTADRSGPEG
jgi:hypothetical protein